LAASVRKPSVAPVCSAIHCARVQLRELRVTHGGVAEQHRAAFAVGERLRDGLGGRRRRDAGERTGSATPRSCATAAAMPASSSSHADGAATMRCAVGISESSPVAFRKCSFAPFFAA
jgi:hypothetical protein